MVDAPAEIVKLEAESAEKIDKFRTREALQLTARFDAQLFQFSLGLLTDSPDFAHGQFHNKRRHVFRRYLELTVGLVNLTGDFRDQLVRTDSGRRCELGFLENYVAYLLGERVGLCWMRGYIEISFIE